LKAGIHFAISLLAALAVMAFCAGGCGKKAEKGLEDVTFRLKWLFNTSVVGDLYADVHGIFADHGLQVAIKEGGPERDAIKELELGHAQFGVASADQVIRAASKGAPIVVIAQLFQANPLQWIYRPAKTPIQTVYDLNGKTIGVTYGGNDETIMKALLSKYEMKKNDIKFFSVRYDYTPFYRGEVDLWPVYQNAEGIIIGDKLRKGGEAAGFFNPDAFGVRFVANSVVTTEHLLSARPETVGKFLRALLEGWRQALDPANEKQAVETIRQFDKDTPIHIIRRQLAATRVLVKPSPETEIGAIDVKAWAETERIMVTQKLIPGLVGVERILRSGSGTASPTSLVNQGSSDEDQTAQSGMKCRICSLTSVNSAASISASTSSASNQQMDRPL
jgi:NitT/TauT family transport system substrate-binding protein